MRFAARTLIFLYALFRMNWILAEEILPLQQPQAETLAAHTLFKDTKIVAYEYDPNHTYPVKTRVNVLTEIDVPDDEKITAYFPSADEKGGWPFTVSGDKRHLFVMPKAAGAVNTATLITNKHSYLLTFESANDGIWFQRVRWITSTSRVSDMPQQYEDNDADETVPVVTANPSLADMFVNYEIIGDTQFTPDLVADNGKFTWFRIPHDTQELPALFVLDEQNRPELVNYIVDPQGMIKAQRIADAWLLKLGDQEVKVLMKGHKSESKSFFGWFN